MILLPNLLHEEADLALSLPAGIGSIVSTLSGLIAEGEKEARRYLRKFLSHDEMKAVPLQLLNEHTSAKEIESLLEPMMCGETWGLISDAGLPCVADPGSDLVALAYKNDIAVQTIAGPSSIMMALQLSGFTGQRFSFHGYLPRELPLLEKEIVELEKRSRSDRATQVWIEAPYRSAKLFDLLKTKLQPSTRLCVAVQLTSNSQRCLSTSLAEWKKRPFHIEKEPAVFLIQSF
ncbi:MAG: SAM-dependent methyltransferase [Chlamydiae bacterium]|nr:SAM-dependent methyltransferase [Chlamydiota bacterium]